MLQLKAIVKLMC